MASMPASNSSGVSTTAAAGRGSRVPISSRQAAIRAPTRGQTCPSSQARSCGSAKARAAIAARSTTPPGATSSPQRATTRSRSSGEAYSSCTTASVDSVAAPSRRSASRAVDLPAPSPPVRPTNGIGAPGPASGRGGIVRLGLDRLGLLGRGLVGGDRRGLRRSGIGLQIGGDLGYLGRGDVGHPGVRRTGEDVFAQAELGDVVEVAGPLVRQRGELLWRQDLRLEHLALDALDAQRQAAALGVDLEDLHLDVVARRDDLARVLDVMRRELGDVDEALDAVEDLDEGTERHDLRDGALELVADVVRVDDALPRILLRLLETQGDALAVAVDVEHLDGDGVADREDLARVVDVRPGQLGDVDQAVDAVEVHERAEVDDVRDLALDDEARLQAVEDLLALLLALLLEHGAPRQDDVVARAVELDDLALDLRAEVLVEVRDAADVDERGGQEAAHPEVDDETALDDLDEGALDRLAGLGGCLDAPPRLLEAGALLGHDQAAVLILLREDEGVDLLAHLDLVVRVDGLANRKLVGGDDPLALVADVDEDLVVVDANDDAGDDLALLEERERRVIVRDDLPVDLEQQAVGAFDDLRF